MRKITRFIFAVALLFCAVYPTAAAQGIGAANKILVVVNDEIITQADLDVAMNAVVAELKNEYTGAELKAKVDEAKREYLNQMIEDRLILQEAKRRGVIVDDAEVDERFKEIKSKFPSEEVFYSEMQKADISAEVLKNRYRENIMMSKLVSYEVRGKVAVTPGEIEGYYKEHSEEVKSPSAVHLRSLMLRFDKQNDEATARQKADDIIRLIKEGRDFGELAKLYSQGLKAEEGGDLGFVEKGQMREDFDEVIFNMKEGEVSAPLKTDAGYFIFKVEEKRESRVRSLSEAREDIENIIFREKAQKRYKDWMAKLKRDAFIQIK